MILITGATGFIGSHLALLLSEGDAPVRALYRNAVSVQKTRNLFAAYGKSALFDKIEWLQADINDIPALEPAFENIDRVYHCAACISFDPKDETLLRKTNIEGTANVVNCCLAFGVRKICHVSSIAALGDPKAHEHEISEHTEWNPEVPHSDYAISKYGAEMEVWRGFQEGLEAVIVNPGIVLGPGFWHSGSGELFSRVADGLPFYTNGKTGFTTVMDLTDIMRQLMESDINGENFIVVSKNETFGTMLQLIAKALQVKPPRIEAKKWMTALVWRIDGLLAFFGKSVL